MYSNTTRLKAGDIDPHYPYDDDPSNWSFIPNSELRYENIPWTGSDYAFSEDDTVNDRPPSCFAAVTCELVPAVESFPVKQRGKANKGHPVHRLKARTGQHQWNKKTYHNCHYTAFHRQTPLLTVFKDERTHIIEKPALENQGKKDWKGEKNPGYWIIFF